MGFGIVFTKGSVCAFGAVVSLSAPFTPISGVKGPEIVTDLQRHPASVRPLQ
jgi:hypothetical protein